MATSGSSEQFNKRCDVNKMSTYRLSISLLPKGASQPMKQKATVSE